MINIKKPKYRFLAGILAIIILVSLIEPLGIIKPLFANDLAEPVIDDEKHFSLTFGWVQTRQATDDEGNPLYNDNGQPIMETVTEKGTVAQSISTQKFNSNNIIGTTRIIYNASGYSDTYESGELNLTVTTPLQIANVGADSSSSGSQNAFYQKSYNYNKDTQLYTYIYSNHAALTGEVYDGYIDINYYVNLNTLATLRNVQDKLNAEEVEPAFEEPFTISCSLTADNNDLNLQTEDLSVKINPIPTYRYDYFNTKYSAYGSTQKNVSFTGKIAAYYDMRVTSYTNAWYNPGAIDYILIVPEYADLSTMDSFSPLTEENPYYETFKSYSYEADGYVAYSSSSLKPIYILYPEEYNNTNQSITLVINNYYDSAKTQLYKTFSRNCSVYLDETIKQIPPTGNTSIYRQLYQYYRVKNAGDFNPFEEEYTTWTNESYEIAKENGIYQNVEIIEAQAPLRDYFSGIYDKIDFPNDSVSYIHLCEELENLKINDVSYSYATTSEGFVSDIEFNQHKDEFTEEELETFVNNNHILKSRFNTKQTYVYNNDTDEFEIKSIGSHPILSLSTIEIYSQLDRENTIQLYESLLAAKQNGENGYILAAQYANRDDDFTLSLLTLLRNISCDLEYYPIYDYYITKNEDDTYNIVATSALSQTTASSISGWKYMHGAHENDIQKWYYIPLYAIVSSKPLNLSGYDNIEYGQLPCEALTENESSDTDSETLYKDTLNQIVRSTAVAFENGMDYEIYADFNELDFVYGTHEQLTEDDFEYTYVLAPGSTLAHLTPNSMAQDSLFKEEYKNEFEWEIYIRTRGNNEEIKFADNNSGYEPGEIISLPQETVSVKIKGHKTPEMYEEARELSATWIASPNMWTKTPWGYTATKTGYGVKIYPETTQRATDESRSSLTAYTYTSAASWVGNDNQQLFDNRFLHKSDKASYSNKKEYQIQREIDKYGEEKYTSYIFNTYKRDGASVSSKIDYKKANLTEHNLINDATISGNLTFNANDNKNVEAGLIDKYSDEVYKINKATQYIVINKDSGFVPSNVNLTPSGNFILDSTREKAGNNEYYFKSHSQIDILDGKDISENLVGCIVVKIDSDFSDDPLIISYATQSSETALNYVISGSSDGVVSIPETYICSYSEIIGGKGDEPFNIKTPNIDSLDINNNGNDTETLQYAAYKIPAQQAASLSGHRSLLLTEKSSATYNTDRIGAGKASAGEPFESKLKVTTAANDLKDVIIYDLFSNTTNGSEWTPYFTSVEIPNPETYDVYYSENENPGVYGEDSSWILYDKSTITDEQRLAIKSIAIVFDSNYTIPANTTVEYPITFTAPILQEGIGKIFKNTNTLYASSYNNGVMVGAQSMLESNETNTELILDKTLVAIRLRDADSLAALQGGTFNIYSADDDSLITDDVFTTATDGMTSSIQLPIGKYYAVQSNTIEGYTHVQDKYYFSITLSLLEKEINIVDAYNKRGTAQVLFHKTDKISGENLAGAVLKVTDVNDSTVYYLSAPTDNEGKTTVTVPWGDYYLEETRVPTGYKTIAKTIITVGPDKVGTIVEMNVEDDRLNSKVTLSVVSAVDDEVIPGATYKLFISDGTEVNSYTTNDDGQIIIDSLDWNDYYFEAVNDPDGYVKNEGTIPFSINKDNFIIDLTDRLNRRNGIVKLIKVDADNPSKKLKGAVYDLYDVYGYKYKTDLVTDNNGEVTVTDLPWGSYYFVESSAPFGYSLSDKKTIINVNKDTASVVQEIAAVDSSTSGSIMITKKIKADEVNLENENPTFIYKITGSIDGTPIYSYYSVITFTEKNYVEDGYLIGTSLMSDLPQCEWNVEEQEVIRYCPSEITTSVDMTVDTDNNVVIGNNNASFKLTANTLNANIIFTNDRLYKEEFSSIDTKVNSLRGENKIVGVMATTDEPSYAPNREITLDDIALYYIEDNGETVLIDPKNIKDPSNPDSNPNATIEISEVNCQYTQPGIYLYPITITVNDNTIYETVVKIEISEFIYEVLDDGTATITGYRGNKSIVEIPTTIDGYTVTQVGSANIETNAYAANYRSTNSSLFTPMMGNEYVEKIIFPTTLKNISNCAFGYGTQLKNLKEVVFQSGTHIENICPYAFDFNTKRNISDSIFYITLEDNVIIDNLHYYAINGSTNNYGKTNYPQGVEIKFGDNSYIKRYYQGCLYGISSSSFDFTEGTEIIGANVSSSSKITSITLPYSLKYLENSAFNSTPYIENCVAKSINAIYGNSSLNYVKKITVPFYTANLFGTEGNYTGYYGMDFGKISSNLITIDESILDGINWTYNNVGRAAFNSRPNSRTLEAEEITKLLSMAGISSIEFLDLYSQGHNEIFTDEETGQQTSKYIYPAIEIPDNIESINTISTTTSTLTFSESTNIKDIRAIYNNLNYQFIDNIIPNSIELMATYLIPNSSTMTYGNFTEESKLKYCFNRYYGFLSEISIIPKNLKMGKSIYTPLNNTTISFNSTDMKLVSTPYLQNYIPDTDDLPWNSYFSGSDYKGISLIDYANANNISFYIQNDVKSIPAYAFFNTKAGKNINNICVNGGKLEIPSSVEYIGTKAFYNVSFENIILNEGIKTIEDYAFYSDYCYLISALGDAIEYHYLDYNLEGINGNNIMQLPNSLEYLGSHSFGASDTISEIYFGQNINYIASDFIETDKYPSLNSIYVNENNPYFTCLDNKTIYNKDMTEVIFTIDDQITIGKVTDETNHFIINNNVLIDIVNPDSDLIEVPEGVTKIGRNAFTGVETKQIVLPSSLTEIGDYAFFDSNIGKINIPASVTRIGNFAFTYTEAINDLNYFMDSQIKVDLSQSQEILNRGNAFSRLSKILDLEIENSSSLKYIGKHAFTSKNLTFSGTKTLIIPKSVEIIDDMAFANCRNIEKVVFEENSLLKEIRFAAFLGVGAQVIKTVYYPNTYNYSSASIINDSSFYSFCFSKLPDSLEIIDDFAFFETQFESYNFENLHNLTYIGDYSLCEFTYRSQTQNPYSTGTRTMLDTKHIVIPENVEYIGYYPFEETRTHLNYDDSVVNTSYISSVYIKSPDIKVASVSTFGTRAYNNICSQASGGFYSVGASNHNIYDSFISYPIVIYGNSSKIEELCKKYGYNYIQYIEGTNKSGFTYKELPDGTLEITGVNPDIIINKAQLIVPSEINGKKVTSIATAAFDSPITRSTIKELIIEDGIKKINSDLFYDISAKYDLLSSYNSLTWYSNNPVCQDSQSLIKKSGSETATKEFVFASGLYNQLRKNRIAPLVSAQLPSSVISIGSPFRGCKFCKSNISSLPNIKEFTGAEITFENNISNDNKLILSEGITEIPFAFIFNGLNSKNGIEVVLPSTITSVKDYGLYSATTNLINNPSFTELGDYALGTIKNGNIQAINNLNSIGTDSFGSLFTDVNDVVVFNSLKEIPANAFVGTSSPKKMSFPAVETIGSYAFNNANIQSVDFNGNTALKTVGANSLAGKCKSITLPDSVEIIEAQSLNYVSNLVLPNSDYIINGRIQFNPKGTIINLDKAAQINQPLSGLGAEELIFNANTISLLSPTATVKTVKFTSDNLKIHSDLLSGSGFTMTTKLTDIYFNSIDAPEPVDTPVSTSAYYRFIYGIPAGTTIHIPQGSLDSYNEWFKLQQHKSASNTIYDSIQAGTINLVEEATT